MARIGWGITGAGDLLLETFDAMERVASDHAISSYLSSAGERVVRIYGCWPRLKRICPGGYYREIVLESEQAPSFPLAGRFTRGKYGALVVSPASANTVAKVVLGIADNLITNIISQAGKGGTPVLIVPTDREDRRMTRLPYIIDREVCRANIGSRYERCPIVELCPYGAIVEVDGAPRIDLTKCEGCDVCVKSCPYGAVSFGRMVEIRARRVDLENVRRLRESGGFIVLRDPAEIPGALEEALARYGR